MRETSRSWRLVSPVPVPSSVPVPWRCCLLSSWGGSAADLPALGFLFLLQGSVLGASLPGTVWPSWPGFQQGSEELGQP